MGPVNLKKLAEELHLSIATVSRALNNQGNTSQLTKERVLKLAQKLNYEPNPHASNLRRHSSKTIAVVLPEVSNQFFSSVVHGIEEVVRSHDYHVLLYLTHDQYKREVAIIRLLTNGRVDGALVAVASTNKNFAHLNLLRERSIPTVFFDRVYDGLHTAQVTTNDYESSYQATRHLLDNGCRTIACLAVAKSLSIGQKRLTGYLDALKDGNIAFDAELVLHVQSTKNQDVRMIQGLLQNRRDIDGIFASLESLAISSYEACRNLGLSIFTDIKMVAFSNLEVASLLHPPLTTITPPAYAIGTEAAKILFKSIVENQPITSSQSLELKSELILRASSLAAVANGQA